MIVVQKYGGTSVSTDEGRKKVAIRVAESVKEGNQVVVVVSAMGRDGDPYSTDTLINLYKETTSKFDKRELDSIMSCGESISSVIVAATISKLGLDAISLNAYQAGIYTNEVYGQSAVTSVDVSRIMQYIDEGKIPVITGFQGVAPNGDITTMGRGGSDTTAAVLAEALDADIIEIYTDVDGMMTADPRVVSDAKKISHMDYEECYQMCLDGAKVLDCKAVESIRRSGKNLVIKNTFSSDAGTLICNENKVKINSVEESIITAITLKDNIIQYNMYMNGDDSRIEAVLRQIQEQNISLDLINFFETSQVFTADKNHNKVVIKILEELNIEYKAVENCSKITVVGYKMHGVPGVMRRVISALFKENIQVLQTGDSNITISCLIDSGDAKLAIRALHDEFKLNKNK